VGQIARTDGLSLSDAAEAFARVGIATLHSDHHLVPALAPRSFSSFDEAAAEAAISRLYGGIHYSFDNNDGLACGKCIAQAIKRRVQFQDGYDADDKEK